jgi:hypothetical protein
MNREWWSWAAIAGVVAGAVSLFLPWRVILFFGSITLSGIEIDDGKIGAVFLAGTTALLFPLLRGEPISMARTIWGSICAAVFIAIAGYHAFNLSVDQANEFADAHRSGIGTWFAMAAGGTLIAAAVGGRERSKGAVQPF